VAISDVSVARLDETASLLAGRGADAQLAELDVSDWVAIGEYAAMIAEHFGVVHQVYNNARDRLLAVGARDRVRRLRAAFAVKLWGVIRGTKASLPRLVASRDGH
jgi:NAD(P)-dependent dehydrogenase (short-subunit alcohol dehydrogenase family)